MKLEVGKEYRDENGEKRGPMRRTSQELNDPWPFVCDFADSKTGLLYVRLNGETQSGMGDHSTPNLIAPWPTEPTGPVRTVTRKEVVPGVYGDVEIVEDDTHQGGIGIYINATMDAARIRAAANSMLAVADAMEDH